MSMDQPDAKAIERSQFALLGDRRFWPLFVTQFLGAFNDNAYKLALITLLTFHAGPSWTSMEPGVLTNLAAGLFMLPFFLFSALSGQLAEKFDKALLARATKLLEIAIILIACLGFWLHSLPVLLVALFLLGLQSTLFGPVKYAILPQHLRPAELVGGNALVEAGTFVAILAGTLAGTLLVGLGGGTAWIVAACLVVAVGGYLASRYIPAAPAPEPELKLSLDPFSSTWRCIGFARQERSVFLSILGISWFWAYGSVLLTQFPVYTKVVLGGNENLEAVLLAIFSVGIGTGSLLCNKLTHRRGKLVEPGLVPLGALGMVICGVDLAFASPTQAAGVALPLTELLHLGSTWRIFFDLLLLGISGGIYCVPLYTLVQDRSAVHYRARVIAANNILNALFMVLASVGAGAFLREDYPISSLFLVVAALHGVVTIYIFSLVPEFLIRALVWLGLRRE